ncbi:MAG TPA: coenzyme F420-0:L-glutamate ligase [Candidatus Limnocylindrales bacterium]|nr:coenzyme F420-0:L-glutamate ligase [Candidatus Limnocylindrales bacterium]
MIVKSYKTHKIRVGDDLLKILDKYLPPLSENSVVAITSKIISITQGDVVKNDSLISKENLIKKEADFYIESDVPTPYGKIFLTRKNGHIVFTAGIDESNADGDFVLWPRNLQDVTNKIWEYLRKKNNIKNLGIIITDSRIIPVRTGIVGFCLSWCGFEPTNSFIGKNDIFGREIMVTNVSVIESLATSATVVMGETNEQTPLAIISDIPFVKFQDRIPNREELDSVIWPIEKDMYGKLLTAIKWKKGGAENNLE